MKKITILLILITVSVTNLFAQGGFSIDNKDIFGVRNFIENKGQFNKSLPRGSKPVKYGLESGADYIYLTANGPVYRLIKITPISHEQKERAEAGKTYKMKAPQEEFVYVNWLNSNQNILIEESEKQSHYFTYGGPEYNSSCFKKITYKNVYNNIDIEYIIPENTERGFKYNVIVHPGGNLNDVKIQYSGNVESMNIKDGNVIIKTGIDNLQESAPVSFYVSGQKVKSGFTLKNNVISFNLPEGYDNTQTLVIDPWVFNITTLNNSNTGFDVDHDYYSNLYVYGGNNNANFNPCKLAKYNGLGTLLWTFGGEVIGISWTTGGNTNTASNFCVHRGSGKTYLGQGWQTNAGVRIIRVDAAGNYDNFVTPADNLWREIFELGFHCGTGNVYGMGGSTNSNYSGGLVNQINGSLTAVSFNSLSPAFASHDIACSAIDDQGRIFIHYQSSQTAMRNQLALLNPAFTNTVWMTSSTYSLSLGYFQTKGQFLNPGGTPNSNAFNCLAVNQNYLFYYDGLNLAAYNKLNGTKIAFITIPAHPVRSLSGIAVDECNNLYIGGNTNILAYNFDGTNFNPLTNIPVGGPSPNKSVYDIKYDKNANLLYVCGSGFVGTYNAIHSGTCGAGNSFSLTTSCNGFNNGSAIVTVTTSIPNPTINYIWTAGGNTISATMSVAALSNSVGNLPNGNYTVQISINAPCGPVFINTVNINCCLPVAVNPSITQSGCTNTLNAVSLAITGGGTVTPVITWSPAPLTVGPGSTSAQGLPVGTTTITMNYSFGCVTTLTVNMLPSPPLVTFTLNNLTGSNTITCLNPLINLQAVSNYTYGTLSYSWTSPSFTAGTPSVSIGAANTITLTVSDPATGCVTQTVIAIGINTTAPSNSVNPTSQAITCNSGSPITFSGTVTNPTVNIQHDWYSPLNPLPGGVPIATSNNTLSILSGLIPPGIYTLETTNLVNGCKSQKTVTVTSLSAWPTFSLNSPTNFSIGCTPLNCTTLSIVNPVSTQTPPATCSYTFLAPSFTGVVTPSVILGGNTSTAICTPGTWTIIVQDNSNWCRTTISVPVIQNTVAPHVLASLLTPTLTCYNPTVLATGSSSTANTVITWNIPQNPPLLSTPTVVIGPVSGPNTSTTSLTYANYTVIATNTLNACQTTSVVQIYQNFKPPISSPTISIGTPTAIYCTAGSNPVVLTTGNSTTTSGGGPSAFVANPCWEGPSPQPSVCGVSSYSCFMPGIYTLSIMDNYNGCYNTGTIQVLDRTQPPILAQSDATASMDCGTEQARLNATITGTNTGGLLYWFFEYPIGTAFSPTNAPTVNGANYLLSGTSSQTVNVSKLGFYQYMVTNTLTGCQALGAFNVYPGGLSSDFSTDVTTGFAPLSVVFTPTNYSGLTGITNIWSFGNGITQTSTTNINPVTVYESPGTYTAMLISQKGNCLDTTYKIINVEMPSKLETPNIFTPNGDGSNDVFILKTANLGEIIATVFDRWGNKVYEVKSATGNIAWDGKNLNGKECAAGVYFYVISANGNDSKEYKVKGNVSLFR